MNCNATYLEVESLHGRTARFADDNSMDAVVRVVAHVLSKNQLITTLLGAGDFDELA